MTVNFTPSIFNCPLQWCVKNMRFVVDINLSVCLLSLKIFAHENSQLKRWERHDCVSALCRVSFVENWYSNIWLSWQVITLLVDQSRLRVREQSTKAINRGWNKRRRWNRMHVPTQWRAEERTKESGWLPWSTKHMLCSSIVLCRLFQAWLNKQILKHFKHEHQHCQNRTQTEQFGPIKLTVYLRHDAMQHDSSDCKWPKLYKMSMFDAELTDRLAVEEKEKVEAEHRDETASWIVELLCCDRKPVGNARPTDFSFRCSAVFPHRIR